MRWFNTLANRSSEEDLNSVDVASMMNLLRSTVSEIAKDLNENLEDKSSQILVYNPIVTDDPVGDAKIQTTRLQVGNQTNSLSIRCRANKIETFIVPTRQFCLAPSSEYSSRLKFSLERLDSWLLDGEKISKEDIKLLLLAVTNDLFKQCIQSNIEHSQQARLRIGDFSLTAGLRDLLFEKAQLLSDVVNQQEALKSELAAELHDSVIADLLLLKRELEGKPEVPVPRVCSILEEVVLNIRELCSELSSRELITWGLSHSICALCERVMERSGVEIEANVETSRLELPHEISLHVYRIAQECINNAIRHAGATKITVRLVIDYQQLQLIIENNGTGLKADHTLRANRTDRGGMGMAIIKERTDILSNAGYSAVFSLQAKQQGGASATLSMDLTL